MGGLVLEGKGGSLSPVMSEGAVFTSSVGLVKGAASPVRGPEMAEGTTNLHIIPSKAAVDDLLSTVAQTQ